MTTTKKNFQFSQAKLTTLKRCNIPLPNHLQQWSFTGFLKFVLGWFFFLWERMMKGIRYTISTRYYQTGGSLMRKWGVMLGHGYRNQHRTVTETSRDKINRMCEIKLFFFFKKKKYERIVLICITKYSHRTQAESLGSYHKHIIYKFLTFMNKSAALHLYKFLYDLSGIRERFHAPNLFGVHKWFINLRNKSSEEIAEKKPHCMTDRSICVIIYYVNCNSSKLCFCRKYNFKLLLVYFHLMISNCLCAKWKSRGKDWLKNQTYHRLKEKLNKRESEMSCQTC